MISRRDLRRFATWVFGKLTQMDVTGTENIPPTGGCILATNHLSRIDTPFLFVVVERNDLCGIVTDKYRFNPLFALFVKVSDSIWINRDIADFQAIRAALVRIKRGDILGIAPEGTRSKQGYLIQAKNGVVMLAEKANVPIVPVALYGTDSAMQKIRSFQKPVIHARFGKPFTLPPVDRTNREESLTHNTDEIMCRIAAMLPEKYRGFYRNYPRTLELIRAEQSPSRQP
jgi:1-acyl-sn-glycerol-3-phosphate acyltransferase